MKPNIQSSSDWLSSMGLLARLHPPKSLVYVGSQPSSSASMVWQQWSVENAVLIDPLANEGAARSLPAGWRQIAALLGAQRDDAASFYALSLPSESGLLPAEDLRTLWPNIQSTRVESRPVITLKDAWAQLPATHSMPDWLVVDALPAVPVLQGAAALLSTVQVVCVRVMLDEKGSQPSLAACGLEATGAYLEAQGFSCVAVGETRHPTLGLALFVRNAGAKLQPPPPQASERQPEAEQADEPKAASVQEQQSPQEKVSDLADLITAERNLPDLGQQLQASQQKCADLEQKLQAALQRVSELEQRLPAIEADRQETSHRQLLMQEELIKAEAQLELIKDLLLREPGL